ncbi:MAG TPA: ZPR1 zinc finger domain-containing protein [Methanocorpusculum sp.]|nr:ZPR1 zinc finger domain-containing protein [Methanocorpusculum sp.]
MRQIVKAPCPDCGKEITFIYDTENIPYFSDILLISGICESCGFRIVDTMVLNEREPCIWEMTVTSQEDLNARVVRSTAGEIDIPEFGLNIRPGPACYGFVSNVEGVLERAEEAVRRALITAEGEEIATAETIMQHILEARDGRFSFTLRITDPTGNSGIVSSKAKKTKLDVKLEDGMTFTPYS